MRIQFREYRDLFAKYLRPRWPKVALLTALMLAGIALQVANPQVDPLLHRHRAGRRLAAGA